MSDVSPAPGPASDRYAYNATLLRRFDLTPGLTIMHIRPDTPNFTFVPGQFTVLGLKRSAQRIPDADPEEVTPEKAERLLRRSYSISSGSREDDYLEFYISLVRSGELTPRLFSLQPGDRLFIGDQGKGVFTLDRVPTGKNILLVATGTGLAPYMSMVRSQALGIACSARPMAILHGASYSWDLGYRGELETLDRRCDGFSYLPVVSRPQEDRDWRGRVGRLTEWVDSPELGEACGFSIDPGQTHVFLCGHPVMVEESAAMLTAKGYDMGNRKEPGTLHMEKYW